MAYPFKLGKLPAKIEPLFDSATQTGRRLSVRDYLVRADLPPVADSCDWTGGISAPGMHLNDTLGVCVEAGATNAIQSATTCVGGVMRTVPDSVILADYESLGGYVAGDESTDRGLVLVNFLNWWRQNTFNGNPLAAYADPAVGNLDEFKLSVQLFGGVLIGVQLCEGDMEAFDAGQPWATTYSAGPQVGGHCVWVPQFVTQGPVPQTWNRNQPATWDWLTARMDENHALFLPEWLNKSGQAPSGVDWQALQRDLALVTGQSA